MNLFSRPSLVDERNSSPFTRRDGYDMSSYWVWPFGSKGGKEVLHGARDANTNSTKVPARHGGEIRGENVLAQSKTLSLLVRLRWIPRPWHLALSHLSQLQLVFVYFPHGCNM